MLKHALFALALIASPAFADPPEEELTAAPGSIAYGMIEQANAEGVFDIVHNGQVSVRHLASGMRCDFERDGEGGQIILFAGLPRGDDVGCATESETEYFTLYATRYPEPRTLDNLLNEAEAAIRQRWPDATPYPASLSVDVDGLPEQRLRHFVATVNGRRHFTSVGVAQMNGWSYKVRYTAAIENDSLMQYELMVGMMLSSLLIEANEAL